MSRLYGGAGGSGMDAQNYEANTDFIRKTSTYDPNYAHVGDIITEFNSGKMPTVKSLIAKVLSSNSLVINNLILDEKFAAQNFIAVARVLHHDINVQKINNFVTFLNTPITRINKVPYFTVTLSNNEKYNPIRRLDLDALQHITQSIETNNFTTINGNLGASVPVSLTADDTSQIFAAMHAYKTFNESV